MLVWVVKEAPLKHPSQITIIFYSVSICTTYLTSSVWAKSPPLPLILTITLTSTSSMDRVEMLTVTVELSRSMWSSGHRSREEKVVNIYSFIQKMMMRSCNEKTEVWR